MIVDDIRSETVVCPGCGGRNDPAARECEWCGRLFVAERRQIKARLLASIVGAVLVMVALGVITVALVGSRSASKPPSQLPATAVIEPITSDQQQPQAAPTQPARTIPPATDAPAPTEPAGEYVRIANTGGTGAFLRREARPEAPGIVAYREGTVLKVVGPDVSTDGRTWRQVEDRQGNRGWTPREYLDSSPVGF